MSRPNKREKLLDTANEVVQQRGPLALTLDLVASESEVSKGGLLYHFPTKKALIQGMVARLVAEFDQSLDRSSPGAFLRSYVELATAPEGEGKAAAAGLVAAVALSPESLEVLRSQMGTWLEWLMEKTEGHPLALTVLMAADGLWYNDVLGLNHISDQQRNELRERLLQLIEELPIGAEQ